MGALFKADFGKIVSVAQAPVSLVIATSIFLHMLTSRYVPLYDRVRALTDELRKGPKDDNRRNSVTRQLRLYVRRLKVTQTASNFLNSTVMCFLGTVCLSAASIVYPDSFSLRLTGMASMAVGVVLLVVSICLAIYEDVLSRSLLDTEMSEFPEVALPEQAPARPLAGQRTLTA